MATRDCKRKKNSVPDQLERTDLLLIEDYIRDLAPINRPERINDYVVIYARYSSELQREESISIQNDRGLSYAKKQGFVLRPGKYLFADSKLSGKDLKGRDELEALRKLAREGGFTRLLIKGVDRLSRMSWQAYMLLEEFATLGIEVHIVGDVSHGLLDPTKAFIDGFFAWREHRKILADTKNGMEAAAWRGENVTKIPYGYKKSTRGEMIVDEEKRPHVIRIHEEFASGLAAAKIAKGLNDDGIPGPTGGKWTAIQIIGCWVRGSGVVRQIKYLGINHWNRTERFPDPVTGTTKTVLRPRSEWILVKKPEWRIVSDDLWRRVMWRLKELARKRKAAKAAKAAMPAHAVVETRERHSDKAMLLFHDRYFCKCGAKMWGLFTNARTRALACSSVHTGGGCERRAQTSAAHVDGEVLRLVREELLRDEAIELYDKEYVEGVVQARRTTLKRQSNLKARIDKLTRRIDKTYTRIMDADTIDEDRERNYRSYRAERDRLRTELHGLRLPGSVPDLRPDAIATFRRQIDEVILRLPFVERTKEDRRLVAALRDTVRRIEIDRPRPRYGFRLVIQTTLSGLGSDPLSKEEEEIRRLQHGVMPQPIDFDNPPILTFTRDVGAPATTYFGRQERADRLADMVASGQHELTEYDWDVAAAALGDCRKYDQRRLINAALFSLRTGQGLWVLPAPYDGKSFANRVHAMITEGYFGRVVKALEKIQSPSVAGLDVARFAQLKPKSAPRR